MDPTTVVIVLAMHLGSTGVLFLLIGRRMAPHSGMRAFGWGGILFGSAFGLRLLARQTTTTGAAGAAFDLAMLLSALLFLAGLRRFLGLPVVRRRAWIVAALIYLLLYAVAVGVWGLQGRFVLLNLSLVPAYAGLGLQALLAMRQQDAALRAPLGLLGGMACCLALLTLVRALTVALKGTDMLFQGTATQVYYTFASASAVLLALTLLWLIFVRLNGQLAELATHDALTRLLNRHGLAEVLQRHFGNRGAAPVVLLQVDVDHFKRVNDGHGHAVGDAVLRRVAAALQAHVRAGDFVARTGGEEFLVGCIDGGPESARELGERLRRAVAETRTPLPDGRGTVACTVSVGVSRPFAELPQWERAAREADQALYAAKQAGRDRVVVSGDEGPAAAP
jgi:diguanylate cyclase (GGDEF)-like protein